MSDNDIDASELARWDPAFTAQANKLVAPIINRWFRVEVRGLESVPPTGGVLLVSNHSGGALTPDPLVFGPAYYDRFGYHRPLYILAHYGVFFTTLRRYLGGSEPSMPTRKTPPRHCTPARPFWCIPAGTTTCTGRR